MTELPGEKAGFDVIHRVDSFRSMGQNILIVEYVAVGMAVQWSMTELRQKCALSALQNRAQSTTVEKQADMLTIEYVCTMK